MNVVGAVGSGCTKLNAATIFPLLRSVEAAIGPALSNWLKYKRKMLSN
jgi:hypothetical protein